MENIERRVRREARGCRRPHPVRTLLSPGGHGLKLRSVESVARNYGRFCELYNDRGSHFCQSGPAREVASGSTGKSARPCACRASTRSWPAHRRLAAVASALSAPSRGGCRRNSGIMALPITPPLIAISNSASSPTSIAASRSSPRNRKAPWLNCLHRAGAGAVEQA